MGRISAAHGLFNNDIGYAKQIYHYLYAYILGICLIIPNTVSAQSSENFTNDATLVSDQGRTAIILSSGIHEKKKRL